MVGYNLGEECKLTDEGENTTKTDEPGDGRPVEDGERLVEGRGRTEGSRPSVSFQIGSDTFPRQGNFHGS